MTLGPPKQSKHTPILKGLHNAIALDYHYKRGVIYWSDVSMDVIRKVYINGSDPEDVLRWGLDTPSGVAIDWIHDLLFWTDAGTSRIEVITLDTKIRHVLVSSDLGKPRAIAVHPGFAYVFWTDWGRYFFLNHWNSHWKYIFRVLMKEKIVWIAQQCFCICLKKKNRLESEDRTSRHGRLGSDSHCDDRDNVAEWFDDRLHDPANILDRREACVYRISLSRWHRKEEDS